MKAAWRGCAAVLVAAVAAAPLAAQEWHEAYRNGVRALAQGRGPRAVELLHLAVAKHPQPGYNVVTYGTNVEPHYFPYLRLAEAYLMTGHLDSAREALRVSQEFGIEPESERAAVRARVEQAAAAAARATPPTVAPSPPLEREPAVEPASPRESAPAALESAAPVPPATPVPPAPSPAATPLAARPVSASPPPRATPRERSAPARPAPVATSSTAPEPAPTPAPAASAEPGATLELLSTPPHAEVYLDDERVGVTDPESGRLLASELRPGRHRLRVTLRGHADHIAEIDLRGGRVGTWRVALTRQAESEPAPFALLALASVIVAAGTGVFLWLRAGRGGRDASWLGRLTGRARVPSTPAFGEGRVTPGRTPLPPGGEDFGDYRLVDVLGRGGMAVVYRAERRGESMALKRPLPHFLDEPEFLERFLREAEIGRTLHHPNIVSILERGDVDGVPYFTMELVAGETLQAWLRRQSAAVPLRRAVEIVGDVAQALDYAHLKGVIHRDLKPSNIMLLPEGAAKVMDYGIARARRFDGLTATGAFLGTPDYVAPETIEGRGSSPRSDLYALGVIFYELIAGRRPFEADTPFSTLRKHCTEPPPPPSARRAGLPIELETIVLRLLAKEPAERYDAEALLVALSDWLNRTA